MPNKNASGVERLLGAKEVVVVCGSGGVGKTTTAAALGAAAAARSLGKVLVLTVDPARRLADALGLEELGNTATRVDESLFRSHGVDPKGELWAAMLDTGQSWDSLIRRYAPSPALADAILANPFYRNITSRFSTSHEYIAMERLYELYAEGTYDLLVIDTPPSRRALDFLDAPERMSQFFSSRLLRWLTTPARSKLFGLASRPFYEIADRVLGGQLLADLGNFLSLFEEMYPGFVERSHAVAALLKDPRVTFMVVTSLEPAPHAEARRLIGEFRKRGLQLGMLVANKVLAPSLFGALDEQVAETLQERSVELAKVLATSTELDEERPQLRLVLEEIGQSYANLRLVAKREAELLAELRAAHELRILVPYIPSEVVDLGALLQIGELIFDH